MKLITRRGALISGLSALASPALAIQPGLVPILLAAGGHNLLLQSENFSVTPWGSTGTPIVTAHTIQDDDAGVSEAASQAVTLVTGAAYTLSFWVLKDAITSRFPGFFFNGGLGNYLVHLNTSTGATGVEFSDHTGVETLSVTDAGLYWLVSVSFTAEGSSYTIRIYAARGTTIGVADVTAVGTVTVDMVQLNPGPVRTRYRMTTVAAV